MTTRSRTRSAIVEAEISDSEDDSDIDERPTYAFDGNIYPTYEEMVTAKRKRNADWMEESGLLKASSDLKEIRRPQPVQNGLVRKKKAPVVPGKRRKSNRLAGVVADGDFVEDERGGKFRITTVAGGDTGTSVSETKNMYEREQNSFYNNRINDGSDLSMTEAVDLCGEKWVDETSATNAMTFTKRFLVSPGPSSKSPTSVVADYSSSVVKQKAETDDVECNIQVAKVTPERIYSVACHPSRDSLIVGAGDKLGNVGLWNVDDSHEKGGDVYLFRPHTRPICCLEWTSSGSNLLTASYDGSVRWFDAESQTFSQVFATYDSSAPFKGELGYGLDDEGSRNWVQYCTGDFRSNQEKCFFMSTSKGNTFHVDLRTKGSLTFHENLSEKKINTVSLHPDGYSLATAGLDTSVKIWDLRKFGDNRTTRKGKKAPSAISEYHAGKSINSAFFSPSGTHLLLTTMADKLELFTNAQLSSGKLTPTKRINHNNKTGRWLTTFMAKWHESLDTFVVGSMQQPRSIEVFDSCGNVKRLLRGEGLSAVASRCCFHPTSERLIVVGGNSSGRVSVSI